MQGKDRIAIKLVIANIAVRNHRKLAFKFGDPGTEIIIANLGILPRELALEHLDFRIPPKDFEPGADFVNAVMDGFKLGSLFDHMIGCCDLAAVMKPRSKVKLVPFHIGQIEIGKRALLFIDCRLGEHAGNDWNLFAMIGGMGRFGVNRLPQHAYETFHQIALRHQKAAVFKCDRRLACQGIDDRFDQRVKGNHFARIVARINQLQHADHSAARIFKRYGQEGFRPVTGFGIKGARAGKIEPIGEIRILDIDRFTA